MGRISLAFRCFFGILSKGTLPDGVITELGLTRRQAAPPPPSRTAADGALQILSILQRDARLLDFIMEDISSYSDDQVGAAVREMHDQSKQALSRYVQLAPVIDGVEGVYTKLAPADPSSVKLLGNVPPQPPPGGTLRHKGWRALKVDLPALAGKRDTQILAPAEVEIE